MPSLRKQATFLNKWQNEMMSKDPNAEISYTDNVSLPWSGQCFWLVMLWGKLASTNQKYVRPRSGKKHVILWNFCAHFLVIITFWFGWSDKSLLISRLHNQNLCSFFVLLKSFNLNIDNFTKWNSLLSHRP